MDSFGAAVALATLPLVIASNVVAGVSGSVAPYQSQGSAAPGYGYAPPVAYGAPRPYYAPYPGYHAAPRASYGPRPYYGVRTRFTTDAGIIVRVAIRIRAGKKSSARSLKGVRKGGRPPRADALKVRAQILEVATDLFLEQGYGSTSIEAVAARAGVSKRTFYDRFDDKAALFAAVVHRIIENYQTSGECAVTRRSELG